MELQTNRVALERPAPNSFRLLISSSLQRNDASFLFNTLLVAARRIAVGLRINFQNVSLYRKRCCSAAMRFFLCLFQSLKFTLH